MHASGFVYDKMVCRSWLAVGSCWLLMSYYFCRWQGLGDLGHRSLHNCTLYFWFTTRWCRPECTFELKFMFIAYKVHLHVLRAEAVLRILDDAQTAKCSCMRIYNKSLLEICAGSVHIRSTCMSSPWTSSLCVSWHMVEWLRKMAELTHPINVMQKPRWLPVALHARHKSGVVPGHDALGFDVDKTTHQGFALEGQTDFATFWFAIHGSLIFCNSSRNASSHAHQLQWIWIFHLSAIGAQGMRGHLS